jgi:hypothetical protein
MTLTIETFSNIDGGNSFFKAVSHPLAAPKVQALIAKLQVAGPVAVYDPLGLYSGFAEFHDVSGLNIAASFVQDIEAIGTMVAGKAARPVTELAECDGAATVLVAVFDADRLIDHIRHLIPEGMAIASLDAIRLDDALLTHRGNYLNKLNFATNFAFFRDSDGMHTRVFSANYWSGYGADAVSLHLILFGEDGAVIAEWDQPLAGNVASVIIDSQVIREQFGLAPFIGQLFIHAVGVKGHDIVKYALDVWSDDGNHLSCTHDANAWPSDLFAGLPAPAEGEDVVLWVQNSHPCPIPAGEIGLNMMGDSEIAALDETVPGFGTKRVSVSTLLPDAIWPGQVEVQAGKHFVRPRYEIFGPGDRSRIAHVNVERSDLSPDPALAELGKLIGKGFILPAPLLPPDRWRTLVLPTPMSSCQNELPIAALLIDASGREIARQSFGRLPRNHATLLDTSELLGDGASLPDGYGHIELVYDFSDGGDADGWLHGLFRYEDKQTGHIAETSFGAHVFNTVLTYRNEPQSYTTRPPGLSTRLFLRLGNQPLDTLCHLIYAASTPWHATSDTTLSLIASDGTEIASRNLEIPCGGSRLWRYSEIFGPDMREKAGDNAYIIIRDSTCRLFGYHGILAAHGPFSLDHMFGF